jgi:hypothetical protein
MKKILFSVLALSLAFASCKKNTKQTDPTSGALSIRFSNEADGKPVVYNQFNYTNEAGNLYSISLLKYYVTNVVLVKDDNSEVKLGNYDLMDAFDLNNFSTVEAADIPFGDYTKLRFFLGVDKARNHSGAQDGDLDPIHNMIWTWSTGYLFMKHEGQFINNIGDTVDIQYHLGTDNALSTVEIPITLNMDKTSKKLNIQFDLNKMYNSPAIDFNSGNIHHSTLASDSVWITQMIANTADAFSFLSQE